MRPLFVDPKTDFAFWKIFGSEEHKPLLIALLNGLLELDEAHRIIELEGLSPEQRPVVPGLRNSIVNVKCVDARGIHYVVEMQVLNVEGFERRVVDKEIKECTERLEAGQLSPDLNDRVGVTLCEFELWPRAEAPQVPMLSRWRMQEQQGGTVGVGRLQLVFLELPKYDSSRSPRTAVEKWAYFFREASKFKEVPEVLRESPFQDALKAARAAGFNEEEWEAYLRAGMAIQDMRGALSLARKEGRREGHQAALLAQRTVLCKVLQLRGLTPGPEEEARIEGCASLETLKRWLIQAVTATAVAEALR